jgi:rifampin ADP-ribosylating transferase
VQLQLWFRQKGQLCGSIDDDPNVTDQKFPGNPTKSYRTREPLRIVGEVKDWKGHSPDILQNKRNYLE